MQEDTKTVLQTTDIAAHLKTAPKPLTDIELEMSINVQSKNTQNF